MIDFGLKPCPLCGGEPEVAALSQGPDQLSAVIKCTDCGLTLSWETEIKKGVSRSGKEYAQAGIDPIQAWNRRQTRADCEACVYKNVLKQIESRHNCNDCGRKPCEHKPRIGDHVRIDCPLWVDTEEQRERQA